MDSQVERYCNIQEPWSVDENDVGHYLFERGIKYSLASKTSHIIYTAKLSGEDLVALKLIFPAIIIKDNLPIEKVSTIAQRVLCNATKVT